MNEQEPDWKHDTVGFDPQEEWSAEDSSRQYGPVTEMVSDLSPDVIGPLVVPSVDIAERGLHKVLKKTREIAVGTGDVVWSAVKAGLWGDY